MIWVLRSLAKLPAVVPLLTIAASTIALLLWEIGRLAPGPTEQPWGRWSTVIPRVAIVTTTSAIVLMGLRFAHVAGAF